MNDVDSQRVCGQKDGAGEKFGLLHTTVSKLNLFSEYRMYVQMYSDILLLGL